MTVEQLKYNKETDRIIFNGRALQCGEYLEVLVFNGLNNKVEWIETKLELDEEDRWYLVGLLGYDIIGLFARM